jgi:hypothetical protein
VKLAIALAFGTGIAFAAPSFAQDQKTPTQPSQAEQGVAGMMMNRDMMARMNKMMEDDGRRQWYASQGRLTWKLPRPRRGQPEVNRPRA